MVMTEKDRLLDRLFGNKERSHENIKFYRAASDLAPVTAERFCAAINHVFAQLETAKPLSRFPEDVKPVDIKQIVEASA